MTNSTFTMNDMIEAISKVRTAYIKDLETIIDFFKLDIGNVTLTSNHIIVLPISFKEKYKSLEQFTCIQWNHWIDESTAFVIDKTNFSIDDDWMLKYEY